MPHSIVKGISVFRQMRNRGYGYCGCALYKISMANRREKNLECDLPRCNWRSRTSSVSPPRCFASRQAKFVTESINSSAMERRSCTIEFISAVNSGTPKTHILDIRLHLYIWINACNEILYCPPHTLISWCILPSCSIIVQCQQARVLRPSDLRWCTYTKR